MRDAWGRQLDEEHRLGRARRGAELHAGLLQRPVALAQVARRAGGDDVFPDRLASLRPRNDVVERQAAAGGAAIHAPPAVPGEERAPRDLALDGARDANVVQQPDHVGPDEAAGRGAQGLVEPLDHLRLALVDEHVGTPHRTHVQRLIAGIQDENVLHPWGKVASRAENEPRRRPVASKLATTTTPWPVPPLPALQVRARPMRAHGPAP